jgi:hypothetical protein
MRGSRSHEDVTVANPSSVYRLTSRSSSYAFDFEQRRRPRRGRGHPTRNSCPLGVRRLRERMASIAVCSADGTAGQDRLQLRRTLRHSAFERFVRSLKRRFHFFSLGHIDAMHENAGYFALIIQEWLIDKIDIPLFDRSARRLLSNIFRADCRICLAASEYLVKERDIALRRRIGQCFRDCSRPALSGGLPVPYTEDSPAQ